jgi:hypothetical protein
MNRTRKDGRTIIRNATLFDQTEKGDFRIAGALRKMGAAKVSSLCSPEAQLFQRGRVVFVLRKIAIAPYTARIQ